METAVARNVDHPQPRLRHLRAERRTQAEAHGAQSAGGDHAARFFEGIKLRGPHLVLAHLCGKDQLIPGQIVKRFQQILRGYAAFTDSLLRERILPLPRFDLCRPFGVAGCFQPAVQSL